jgi:NitT/TauT family transport system ATP-binding protein
MLSMTSAGSAPRDAVLADEAAAALEVRGLAHTYRARNDEAFAALGGIDFSVEPGEFVSIVGPSGCGKTTLLSVLADTLQPTRGEARVNGKPPRQARLDRDYSFVFQRPVLFEWRSVLDNVALPLELRGVDRGKRADQAHVALAQVGVERFEGYAPWQLSAGLQQRVALARALVTRPKVLLLDEPFASLDEITREELNVQLALVCERLGTTALLVTHSVTEAVWLSDRVIVMTSAPGRIVDCVQVPLPRPRTADVRETPVFFETVIEVQRLLRAGVFESSA